MNVDADEVRRMLAEEKARGRSSIETAGIALWLDTERERQGLLSEQTRHEAEEVILEWLRGETQDRIGAHELAALALADYLTDHIDVSEPDRLDVHVAECLQRWRAERQA